MTAGRPVRFTGDTQHTQSGDWAEVVPLDENGRPTARGTFWVLRDTLKRREEAVDLWPGEENARSRRVVERVLANGCQSLQGRGANHCALALRLELGINEPMGDAAVAWRNYMKRGWQLRGGDTNIMPGDLLFYVPGHSDRRVQHTGIAAVHDGRLMLLSHETRGGRASWRWGEIGDPTYALYEPAR